MSKAAEQARAAHARFVDASAKVTIERRTFLEFCEVLRAGFLLRKPWARERAQAALMQYRQQEITARRTAALQRQYVEKHGAVRVTIPDNSIAMARPLIGDEAGHRVEVLSPEALELHADEVRTAADALQALLDEFPAKTHWLRDADEGPTPETLVRPSRIAPIPELYQNGHIDRGHVAAALEISRIVEQITSAVSARAGAVVSMGRGSVQMREFIPAQIRELWAQRYVPWTVDQRLFQGAGTRHLALCLDVVVYGASVGSARAKHRIGYQRAVTMIREGLADYGKLMD